MPPRRASLGAAVLRLVTIDGAASVLSLVLIPYLIRRLGITEYAVFAFLSVLTNQLTPLHLGIGQAGTLLVAAARGRGAAGEVHALLEASLLCSLCAATLCASAALLAWPLVAGRGLGLSTAQLGAISSLAAPIALLMAVQPVLGALQGHLLGLERYHLIAGLRAAQTLARPLLVLALVAVSGTLAAAIVGLVATDLFCAVVAWASSGGSAGTGAPGTLKRSKMLVRTGVPFAALGIAFGLLNDAERLAVAFLRPSRELAYYSIAANGMLRLGLIPGVLAGLLVPRLAALNAAGRRDEATRVGCRATRLGVYAALAAMIPLVSVLPELLVLWLGAEIGAAVRGAALTLLVGLAASAWSYASHAALKSLGRTGVLNAIAWIELPIYSALVLLAVARYGYQAAATCLLVRMVFEAAIHGHLADRELPGVAESWRPATLAITGFALFCVSTSWLEGSAVWVRLTAAACLLGAVSALLLRREDVRVVATGLTALVRGD